MKFKYNEPDKGLRRDGRIYLVFIKFKGGLSSLNRWDLVQWRMPVALFSPVLTQPQPQWCTTLGVAIKMENVIQFSKARSLEGIIKRTKNARKAKESLRKKTSK